MTREKWGKKHWATTIALVFIFPPIGIAALLRYWSGCYVWGDEPTEGGA